MPEFIDWASERDRGAVLGRVADLLDAGRSIVVPTETGPALVARADRGARLDGFSTEGLSWSLALPETADIATWTGPLPAAVRRLMKRAWPGPLVVEMAGAPVPGTGVSESVARLLASNGGFPLRRPGHDAILDLLASTDAPLVLAEPTAHAAAWIASLGDAVDAVLDDGPAHFDQPPTRIRVEGGAWAVTSAGVYSEEELRRLSACLMLFVCTGNTCRSPMAEGIFKVMLADRLGCPVGELPSRGWWVMSAGVSAHPGDESAAEARAAVAAFGADLSDHRSRPVRPELAAVADYIVAMTRSHVFALGEQCVDLGVNPRLLCGDEDLPDPVGGDQAVYDECANIIQTHLASLVAEVTAS